MARSTVWLAAVAAALPVPLLALLHRARARPPRAPSSSALTPDPPSSMTQEVTVMRPEKVSFVAGADACAGYLFVPEAAAGTDTRWPCVVLAHGFSGTMDRLVPYAERFAAGGLAALVFDYRGFGESGGQPRQVVDLPSQHEDLRAAIAWVRGRHDLDPDRVALWGSSLGGGHVISVGADDPGIAAVAAQIPFNGFPRVRDRSTTASLRLLAAMLWDALRGKLGLSPAYIPMIGRPARWRWSPPPRPSGT